MREVEDLEQAFDVLERDIRRRQARAAGQDDLGEWCEMALGHALPDGANLLWSKQRDVGRALSHHRAAVAVPSCNSAGKTFLASALVLAFYDCFPDGKVVTTSSTWEHLRDELWSELRGHVGNLAWPLEGKILPGALRIEGGPNHYVIGRSPDSAESMQGYHAPHVLLVLDEATSVNSVLAEGLETLRASGDCRILAIFNPTDDTSWAYNLCQVPSTQVVRIPYDSTPNFTGEPVPPKASLIEQSWLDDLVSKGAGPGSLTWTTKVEANFWTLGDDRLIPAAWYDDATRRDPGMGPLIFGIDLAAYGSGENVIAWRQGRTLTKLETFRSMRLDWFFRDVVGPRVRAAKPSYVVYDGDGPGGGVYGEAERACGSERLIVVRGGVGVGDQYRNLRSAWWWRLRTAFERGDVAIAPQAQDPILKQQLTMIRYGFSDKGAVAVETKEAMRRRGQDSPDRADAVMYAFAWDQPDPAPFKDYLESRSEEAMWGRDMAQLDRVGQGEVNPFLGVTDW